MKQLYYVRHGQSESNLQRVFAGRADSPLTSLGIDQANEAGIQLQHIPVDYIISSPSIRAYDTARIIARRIGYPESNIETNDLLVERDLSAIEGESWDDIATLVNHPGVETFEAMLERAKQALAYIQSLPYDTVVVTSHGSFWRALRGVIDPSTLKLDDDEPANAEIQKLI